MDENWGNPHDLGNHKICFFTSWSDHATWIQRSSSQSLRLMGVKVQDPRPNLVMFQHAIIYNILSKIRMFLFFSILKITLEGSSTVTRTIWSSRVTRVEENWKCWDQAKNLAIWCQMIHGSSVNSSARLAMVSSLNSSGYSSQVVVASSRDEEIWRDHLWPLPSPSNALPFGFLVKKRSIRVLPVLPALSLYLGRKKTALPPWWPKWCDLPPSHCQREASHTPSRRTGHPRTGNPLPGCNLYHRRSLLRHVFFTVPTTGKVLLPSNIFFCSAEVDVFWLEVSINHTSHVQGFQNEHRSTKSSTLASSRCRTARGASWPGPILSFICLQSCPPVISSVRM